MAFSADIQCWDSFGNWAIASASGIAVVAALAMWSRYFSRSIRLRTYLLVFTGFTLSMASLLGLERQYRESVAAENLTTLRAFNSEADRLFEQSLTLDNAADYAAYMAKADGFSGRLERWVADNIGPRASEILLRHDPKHTNMRFENTMSKDHAAAMVVIIQTRENIAALIEARAADQCVKPTSLERLIPQVAGLGQRPQGWFRFLGRKLFSP